MSLRDDILARCLDIPGVRPRCDTCGHFHQDVYDALAELAWDGLVLPENAAYPMNCAWYPTKLAKKAAKKAAKAEAKAKAEADAEDDFEADADADAEAEDDADFDVEAE